MKDIIIPAKKVRYELWTLLICFVLANAINLYAIITFKTKLIELLSMLGYVITATLVLYAAWSLFRILLYLIKKYLPSIKHIIKSS